VHLSVDTAIAHKDLEGTQVTPGVVPGVDTEPVVLARIGVSSPTDGLDSMTTEGIASRVLVDTTLVGKEILIDSEGCGNGTILLDIGLDGINATDTVRAIGEVLVISVDTAGIIGASLGASGLNLNNIITFGEGGICNVMGALCHGVVVAGTSGAVVTSGDNTSLGEPAPWGADLTTVTAH